MKVIATNKYQELGLEDAELHRILMEGEELEVTEERYKVLSGNNSFGATFVKPLEEVIHKVEEKVETAKKEVKKEKAVKKTTKTTKNATK